MPLFFKIFWSEEFPNMPMNRFHQNQLYWKCLPMPKHDPTVDLIIFHICNKFAINTLCNKADLLHRFSFLVDMVPNLKQRTKTRNKCSYFCMLNFHIAAFGPLCHYSHPRLQSYLASSWCQEQIQEFFSWACL